MGDTEIDTDSTPAQKESAPAQAGFLKGLLSFIFSDDDPKKERRRLLKDIGKSLKKMKQKYYNPRQELVLPALAGLVYEYYKLLGPAQQLVRKSEAPKVLKAVVIESCLNDELREVKARLDVEAIQERARNSPVKAVAAEVKDDITRLYADFTHKMVRQIDTSYAQLSVFLELIHFDYFFFLKKFDAAIAENSFTYKPKFEAINADYVCDELKDFNDILLGIDNDTDWNRIFDTFKMYRDMEVVPRNLWRKAFRKIIELKKSHVFELMIQHISKDPFYTSRPAVHREQIVDQFLTNLKTQAELTLQKTATEKKNKKIEQLAMAVFNTTSVSRMNQYTEKANLMYKKHMMAGFLHVPALNYTKAFLLDFYKKDIRELMDLLLIKGKWSSQVYSQALSDSYHQLAQLASDLLAFDESLSEEDETGRKLRSLFHKVDRDKSLVPHARKMLMQVNDEAKALIAETGQNFVALGKGLKTTLEDSSKKLHQLIMNWKEVDTAADGQIKNKIVAVYKKIYYFVQLLSFYGK